ncbi:hypothetical protein LI058_05960 [Clostridium perfringens]|uniref:hypothetical protein n=1 Tax=Clostridium perfringens TaxID=1502 RepID=UPI0022453B6A|nr:hypothetical protein [Clostridium perfringens]MCX0363238.1 hypothetical protein [Clostridium perfringens]MCX0373007.1 hypothetical protein [Clostridium perfringens]
MLNYKIEYLKSLAEYFNNFVSIECKQEDVMLLKSIKGDLEEFLRVKEENKHLKEQLELYKWENEGLRHAYIEKLERK